MHPFVHLLGLQFPSYGLMVIVGVLISFSVMLFLCMKKHIDITEQLYFTAFIILFTILGAKLLYQFQNLPQLWTYRDTIFHSWQSFLDYLGSGFVFYGGLIGGCVGAVCYSRYFKVNAIDVAQNFATIIPLFHCFGRIGCFLAGCCYGISYSGPFSVTYQQSLAAPNHIPFFPVQLLEAGINFILFLILFAFDRKLSKPLQNFGLYAILYGIERFFLEFLRGDQARGSFMQLSTSQWISILMIIPVGVYMFFNASENNKIVKLLLNNRTSETSIRQS